jgi:hypothetical protein
MSICTNDARSTLRILEVHTMKRWLTHEGAGK